MREFRFGFNVFAVRSREEFIEECRTAERYGYDVALTADHLGMPAPFPVLVAAAEATDRLRLGTLVLNIGFWNPHLLARDVATVDRLTEGRVEVGLGAGHMKWEFDAAGIDWEPFGTRVDRMEHAIEELGRLFAADGYDEQRAVREEHDLPPLTPVQHRGFGGFGPPLQVGGTGDRVLKVAARHADIVGIGGLYQLKGQPPGTLRLGTAAEADERVAYVRDQAGDRFADLELGVLVQLVTVTPDRRAAAEELVANLPGYTVDEALETPFLLIGTEEQIAEQLRENRERYGFSYICVHGPHMPALGPVIERLH